MREEDFPANAPATLSANGAFRSLPMKIEYYLYRRWSGGHVLVEMAIHQVLVHLYVDRREGLVRPYAKFYYGHTPTIRVVCVTCCC
uniref:Uncharacterized protein n=1 Tax=Aegilops tauschii subsp. strangulata TaxID=200361 RepID=A0A453G2P3_AEGTS